MDENKDKTPDASGDEPLSSTFDRNTEDIKNEMDELAATFQRELDKTKAEATEKGELIQELEDIPEKSEANSESDEIPEDQLCDCCGEKRRGTKENPDSLYCSDCDDGLRHYPFNFLNVFFVVAVLALVFYSGYIFADHMEVMSDVYKADKLVSQNKITSSLDAYSVAANTMVNAKINGEMVYKREILAAYSLGYIQDLSDVSSNIHSWELNLPHFKSVKEALKDSADFIATAQAAYSILSENSVAGETSLPYDKVIDALTALETAGFTETTTAESSTTSTTAAPSVKATKYNLAMIYFYKYQTAVICDKDISVQIEYLEQIKNEYPQYIWLYGSMLGDLYAKTGRDVTEICDMLKKNDAEDSSALIIEVESLRIKGNYDEAISRGGQIIASGECKMDYEIYRQAALAYLAKGEYENAYTAAQNAYSDFSYSVEVVDTVAICAAATGNEDTYNDMSTILTENGYSLSPDVTGFKAGTLTLDDILLKGDYDVE